jgi:hypothetical protein
LTTKIGLSRYSLRIADDPESDLAMAVRHVAEGRRIVAQQRERIARLKAAGHPTLDHEQTLQIFETNLRIFENHERHIRKGLGLVT